VEAQLLKVEHLGWRYIGSSAPALDDINFELQAGEVLGVTGPSGAGKTTLTLAMNGLIPQNFRGDFLGTVRVKGRSTQDTSVANLVQQVGIVFQDPETQFMGLSVEEELVSPLENLGLSDADIEQRVQEALAAVHMEAFAWRSPFDLSGGQKQKIAIAAAMALRPSVLVLDEPTSELDPVGAEEVFAVLHELKERQGMGILLVSHATEELAAFCDRVLLLHQGRQIRLDTVQTVFTDIPLLEKYGVQPPQVSELAAGLLLGDPAHWPLTLAQAADVLRWQAS
jgi:energy-coupling factor transporter ATP-binding protein EcfA2